MKSLFKKKVIISLFFIVIILSGCKIYFYTQNKPVNIDDSNNTIIEIPAGVSCSEIAKILKQNKIIKNQVFFRFFSKINKADEKIKSGEYILKRSMSAKDILDILIKGKNIKNSVKITIPEGFEFNQIVDRLEKNGLIDKKKFIQIANYQDFKYPFLKDIPKGENRLEGYLFPDTYIISKKTTEEEIIIKMLDRFEEIFKDEYYVRTKELNMTVQEVITLASIIEKEAKMDSERPLVSSVFHNRIKKGMFIQSCATVQYILGERKTILTNKDIQIDSPYNTYKYLGLPPKPIASPGEASIIATLYPENTDYLYFVAKKDGKHTFSKTYQEHLNAKNVNGY